MNTQPQSLLSKLEILCDQTHSFLQEINKEKMYNMDKVKETLYP